MTSLQVADILIRVFIVVVTGWGIKMFIEEYKNDKRDRRTR